jgi:undecaprenyl-diphosphatase
MTNFLAALDTQIFIAIHSVTHNPYADQFVMLFTDRYVWVPMYVALAWCLWRCYGTKKTLIYLIAIGLTITFADQICASFIRPFVERLRPANLANPLSRFVHVVNGYRGGMYGFPSCHAANTFALASILMLITRNRWLTVFIYTWAVLNCYTRLYLGVHYPGDLMVGATVGTLIALGVRYALNYVDKPKKITGNTNFIPAYIVAALTVAAIAVYSFIW